MKSSSQNPPATLCLILHAHLPFVRHPEHERAHEELWLFEALTECYLPLAEMFERLRMEGVSFRLTLSLSSTLICMLEDELLRGRYLAHWERLAALAEAERRRAADPARRAVAEMYIERLHGARDYLLHRCGGRLLEAFVRLRRGGAVELITTAATHAFLPAFRGQPECVRAQVRAGLAVFRRALGFAPRGFWLPECGYYPGLEKILAAEGIRWFCLDTHGLDRARSGGRDGKRLALRCRNGVAVFGRDPVCSRQVWSAAEGYPGDPDYREFHRDLGFDAPLTHLRPFLPEGWERVATGLKFHRITGGGRDRELYNPARAAAKAAQHAAHFLAQRAEQAMRNAGQVPPLVIVAPYDAELFGHWWFEGPLWLEHVLRGAAANDALVRLATPGDYLRHHAARLPRGTPVESSWGLRGHAEYWIAAENRWIYPHLRQAGLRWRALRRRWARAPARGAAGRALRQAARELLLAQASDWPFMIRSGTTAAYAERRLRDHLARFHWLADALEGGKAGDSITLQAIETLDAVFPRVDPAWWR